MGMSRFGIADEACDILEAVLAADRADIPAVTQRRNLARQTHPHDVAHRPPAVSSRCEIPAWFDVLVQRACSNLEGAEQHAAVRNALSRQRIEALADAVTTAAAAERDTAPARELVSAAAHHADDAATAVRLAERRLADARRRHTDPSPNETSTRHDDNSPSRTRPGMLPAPTPHQPCSTG